MNNELERDGVQMAKKRYFSITSLGGLFMGFFRGATEEEALRNMYRHFRVTFPDDAEDVHGALRQWKIREVPASCVAPNEKQ